MRPTRRLLLSIPRTVRSVLADAPAPATASSSSSSTSATPAASSSTSTSEDVTVHGWIRSVRAHKNVAFAEVGDGSGGEVQVVLKGKGRAEGLTAGTAVTVTGQLKSSRGAGQTVELAASELTVLGPCDPETYPIQKKAMPAALLREHAHLRFRTGYTSSAMRVRDALARDWHDWLEDNEFVHVHTPILTSSDCEGAGEVFTVAQSLPAPKPSTPGAAAPPPPFFPRPVNLTVSGQLHLEAPTHALARTYTLSPCFRAEPSQTSRHLAEFYMLEAEVAFVRSLTELCDVVEAGVRDTLHMLLHDDSPRSKRAREDLARMSQAAAAWAAEMGEQPVEGEAVGSPADPLAHLVAAADAPFARISYTDAVALLQAEHAEAPFAIAPRWEDGLASEHEKWLSGVHFARPTFVTDYPASLKPFYMLASDAAGPTTPSTAPAPAPTVAAFDLLFPGIGEMAGGSLREHRLDALTAAIEQQGLHVQEYAWYSDLRRFGSVPHGGWGMGWERWVCWVTGAQNVRDVVAFPRWAGNCRF